MSKRIVLFNHKGGVSKTTSVYNIGWKLSKSYRVLLVDADPQCNLSSLILGDNFEKYYVDEATKNDNLKDGVKVAFEGKPYPINEINCVSPKRSDNLFLLAGHANLSEYESSLSFSQTSSGTIATLQNLPGVFAELLRLVESKYQIDFTIIDLNPSLSAINQNFFIISDGFIVPTNPDPFSLMALTTLKNVLPKWVGWKVSNLDFYKDAAYPIPEGIPRFIGTLIQRFNIRRGKAAEPYKNNIDEIKEATRATLFPEFTAHSMALDPTIYEQSNIHREYGYCLQEISDFQSLLPKSYQAGVPVFELTDEELGASGPVLDQLSDKRKTFNTVFENIFRQVERFMAHV